MIEPCPFKVGDLVRYIDDDPRDALARAVGTVIATPVRTYSVSALRNLPGSIVSSDYDVNTHRHKVKEQMVTVKFWQDPEYDHDLGLNQVEKVEP